MTDIDWQLRALKAEAKLAEAQKLIHVPGQWRCAKCNFVVHKMVLCANSGAVGLRADTKTEPCPNGCGPLWPCTWKDDAFECGHRLEQQHEEITTLKSDNAALGSRLKAVTDAANNLLNNSINHYMNAEDMYCLEMAMASQVLPAEQPPAPATPAHILYKDGDADTPDCVKDHNGDVVLGMCRVCRRCEVELDEPCTPRGAPTIPVQELATRSELAQGRAALGEGNLEEEMAAYEIAKSIRKMKSREGEA